jgi:uncharacterized protein
MTIQGQAGGHRQRAGRSQVAVVGAGVAGLTAAYLLQRVYDVTLYEAQDRLGGHAHTHEVAGPGGRVLALDSGFLVHNTRTYPHLIRLFAELGITTQETEMSMSVRCEGCGLEYARAVVATHPDDALQLLDAPTAAEKEVLGAFRYTSSQVVLHTDATVLPRARAARASWNYLLRGCSAMAADVHVSYHLNRLQGLDEPADYLVTLNALDRVRPDRVLARMTYGHPLYDVRSVAAQRRLPGLNTPVLAFAGAYHGWGFHEDGCRSGAEAARALGVTW